MPKKVTDLTVTQELQRDAKVLITQTETEAGVTKERLRRVSLNGYADAKKAEAIEDANAYADTKKAEAIEEANAYADSKKTEAIAAANAYADTQAVAAESAANNYANRITVDKLAIVVAEELPTGEDIKEKTIYCIPDNKGGHDKWLYVPDANKTEADCWEQFGGGFGGAMVIIDAEDGATAGVRPAVGAEGVDYYIQNGDSYTHQVYRVIDGTGAWYYIGQDQALANRVSAIESDMTIYETAISGLSADVEELKNGGAGGSGAADLEYNEDDDNKLYLVDENGTRIGDGVTITGGGGGGGVAYAVTIHNTTEVNGAKVTSFTTAPETKQYDAIISFWWEARQNGIAYAADATLKWYVNGQLKLTEATEVEQGDDHEISRNVAEWLTSGVNRVTAELSFTAGETEVRQSKTWTVTLTQYSVAWNLKDIAYYTENSISAIFTVAGTGNKTLKIKIDDGEAEVIENANGMIRRNLTPEGNGEHTVSAWVETTLNGREILTEPLRAIMVCNASGTTLSVLDNSFSVGQYETVTIRWMASGADASHIVKKWVRDNNAASPSFVQVGEESVDRTLQVWRYKCRNQGDYTLKLSCGAVEKTISLVVTASTALEPVTQNLIMEVDPTGHSNSEVNRCQFGYTDGGNVNHPFIFSENFDWTNGGFKEDENGATAFVIRRGTSITFDRGLFRAEDDTVTNGKCISIQFRGRNSVNYDATLGHSWDGNTGLRLNLHDADFACGGNPIQVQYCEDSLVEMALNITADGNYRAVKFWMSGVPAKANLWTLSSSFTQSPEDKFTLGSDDCDVWLYRFKMYSAGLTDNEMLSNYILDCVDSDELLARYNRNRIYNGQNIAVGGEISIEALRQAAPDLHIIVIESDRFPAGKSKSDAVPCTVRHYKGTDPSEEWTAEGAKYVIQGTSSTKYVDAAGNLDIDMRSANMVKTGGGAMPNGYAMTDNSIPVKYFNLKANVASSENANNVCVADLFNSFNPLISAGKAANRKVRDTVEGHPCAVFITNTGSGSLVLGHSAAEGNIAGREVASGATVLYFAGDLNNSKKNTEVFAQTDDEHGQVCVEFLENNLSRCLFKSHDFDNEWWDEDDKPTGKESHFGFRYEPSTSALTAQAKERFTDMHEWVWQTDCYPDASTGYAFSEDKLPKVYNGVRYENTTEGHRAYRRAKFTNELADYFDVDGLAFYYVFTEFFLSIDQRAKNTFCSYEADSNGVWRWNFSKLYDADSVLGIDNLGDLRLTYGLEDHPTTEGTGLLSDEWVYDTPHSRETESVLWANLRECFAPRLETIYKANDTYLFDAARIIDKFNRYQRTRPEALMIDSYRGVYDDPYKRSGTTTYLLKMLNGEKREQREQFLRYQQIYMSSKYNSSKAQGDYINIRSNAGANYRPELTITPYADMYACVNRDGSAEWERVRVSKGTPVTVAASDGVVPTSAATYVYSASNIMRISTAAWLYPTNYTAPAARKLRNLLIGDSDYSSAYELAVSPSTVPMAEVIDMRGQTRLANTQLDLTGNEWLRELLLQNTNATAVIFAEGCPLEVARLGDKINTLSAIGLKNVSVFTLDSYTSLRTLRAENCEGLPLEKMLERGINLQYLRLTGVDMSFANASTLLRLANNANLHGITVNGAEDDSAEPLITGSVTFTGGIGAADRATIEARFPGLTVNGASGLNLHLVTFLNDGVVFDKQYVPHGGNATDPVGQEGYGIPQKASDVQYNYSYSSWDKSLLNIGTDLEINAVYSQYTRSYIVTFRNGSDVIYSESAYYGDTVTYSEYKAVAAGATAYPQKAADGMSPGGYLCTGFNRDGTRNNLYKASDGTTDTFEVLGQTDLYAQFEPMVVPASVTGMNSLSWAQIKAIAESGEPDAGRDSWYVSGKKWFSSTSLPNVYASLNNGSVPDNAKSVTIKYYSYTRADGTSNDYWSPNKDYYADDPDYVVTENTYTLWFMLCDVAHDYKVTGSIRNSDDSVLTDSYYFRSKISDYSSTSQLNALMKKYRDQCSRDHSLTFFAAELLPIRHTFVSNSSAHFSWTNSRIRKLLTGYGDGLYDYDQILWDRLPFDLRAAITPALKFSNSSLAGDTDVRVSYASIDKLFIPAYGEVTTDYAKSTKLLEVYESPGMTGAYKHFTTQGNRVIRDVNGNNGVVYWLRTRGDASNNIRDVTSTGGFGSTTASSSNFGVPICFCI